MPQELVAVMGDRKPARMALEQNDTQITLQFLDRFGDGGLGNRQVLRGPRDRALFGHGDEILELSEGECHGALEEAMCLRQGSRLRRSGNEADWCGFVTQLLA